MEDFQVKEFGKAEPEAKPEEKKEEKKIEENVKIDKPKESEIKEEIKPEAPEPEKKPSRKELRKLKKKAIEDFNNNPVTNSYGVQAVNKRLIRGLYILGAIIVILILIGIFWRNWILMDKNFSVNVQPANNVSVNSTTQNTYQNTYVINNTNFITLPSNLVQQILNLGNSTNSTG